jgi:hypothetical protein
MRVGWSPRVSTDSSRSAKGLKVVLLFFPHGMRKAMLPQFTVPPQLGRCLPEQSSSAILAIGHGLDPNAMKNIDHF